MTLLNIICKTDHDKFVKEVRSIWIFLIVKKKRMIKNVVQSEAIINLQTFPNTFCPYGMKESV